MVPIGAPLMLTDGTATRKKLIPSLTIPPATISFTGRSGRPTAWSMLLIGVATATKMAAIPSICNKGVAMTASAALAEKSICRIGPARAKSPSPAGIATKQVMRMTASTFRRNSFSLLVAQAVATAGRALTPRVVVREGTRLKMVMASAW